VQDLIPSFVLNAQRAMNADIKALADVVLVYGVLFISAIGLLRAVVSVGRSGEE
jgi:hypothetical protein